ncbi:glycosyltransferase family 2 protein [Nocardia sp. NPDC059240]|uniref:glycosyltransferase family 2 protein n=1 Tax=Nocardia sp. NPDC059240 TaxID=3346786 RepID=UPI0036BA331B
MTAAAGDAASNVSVVANVSVVVPTVGRASLRRAVESALGQTGPVAEVLVVAAEGHTLDLPSDPRITVVRTAGRLGAGAARQAGIDAAHGTVIALLDDDDEWLPEKLRRQLEAVELLAAAGRDWICSSRIAVSGPGERRRVWPRRLIAPRESVARYLFRFTSLRVGDAVLQTSTLCFPIELARTVGWDTETVHDEPTWLLAVQRAIPEVRLIQLPVVLTTYYVGAESVSRSSADRVDDHIAWGLEYLRDEPARIRGDYLCTSPVSAAVAAGSLAGVGRALRAALRHGRPGPFALVYAVLNGFRIIALNALRIPLRR